MEPIAIACICVSVFTILVILRLFLKTKFA